MDTDSRDCIDRIALLLEKGNTFLAYKESRRLQALIRAALPRPIVSNDHYANPELALRIENTFPGWRMEVPPLDANSPPTFTPILRFSNPLSVTDDQCLVFAHDLVGSLGPSMAEMIKHNRRDFLRSSGRSAMMNLTSITEERFTEVNGRLAYWGEGFLPAQNQQAAVVAIYNEISDHAIHILVLVGADHYSLTRSLIETFLDRMCFEKIDLLPG